MRNATNFAILVIILCVVTLSQQQSKPLFSYTLEDEETMLTPGAMMSGFCRPSRVGPRLEK